MQATLEKPAPSAEGAGRAYPNETIRSLLERKSVRKYAAAPVEPELLDLVAECGKRAPSALGKRDPLIIASTDAATNLALGKISRALSTERERGLAKRVSADQPSIIDDPSIEDAFYGAPAMLFAFSPSRWEFAREDAAIAADAMMVAAQSLGLGTCYISRAAETFATPYGREWMCAHGVPEDCTGAFCLCVGYAA